MVTAAFAQPLKGDEDDQERKRWANMVEARKAVWPTGIIKIDVLFDVALQGRAWQEYAAMSRQDGETEEQFFARVVKHFSSAPKVRPSDLTRFLESLRRFKLKKSDQLEDVMFSLQKEISRLGWRKADADALVTSTFIELLPEEVQPIFVAKEALTPAEALAMAKRVLKGRESNIDRDSQPWNVLSQLKAFYGAEDSKGESAGGAVGRSDRPSISQAEIEDMIRKSSEAQSAKIDAMAEAMSALKVAFEKTAEKKPQSEQKNRRGNRVNSLQQGGPRLPCQICNKKNHTTERCWFRNGSQTLNAAMPAQLQPPQAPAMPELRCQLCDGPGHAAKVCTSRATMPYGSRPQIICYRCGLVGHKSNACPSNPFLHHRQPRFQQQQLQYIPVTGMNAQQQGQTGPNGPFLALPSNVQPSQALPQGMYLSFPPPNTNNGPGNQ